MQHYIGVDFHMQHSSVAVMDEQGLIVDERKLYHANMKELMNYFSSFNSDTNVAVEATRNWYWLIDCLQDLNLNVKLAHAKKVRIIAESTIKTDKIDARALAHLDRCNFLPQAYIADKKTRSNRELLRYHMSLVKIRASIKNRIHAILAKNNIQYGFTDLFGKGGLEFLKRLRLPPIFTLELHGYIQLLDALKEALTTVQKQIKEECKDAPYVKRLITIPGIAYFSALLLSSEIADIKRFRNYKKLCAYAGLASTTHQSADTTHHGGIIKDSNKYLRYVLVEAVPFAIKKDPRLYAVYTALVRKKGVNKARIAIAHRLMVAIYFMLRDDTDYHISNYNRVNPVTKLGA
jgi:transposase